MRQYTYKEFPISREQWLAIKPSIGKMELSVSTKTLKDADLTFLAFARDLHFELLGGPKPAINNPLSVLAMFKQLIRKYNEHKEESIITGSGGPVETGGSERSPKYPRRRG